MATFVDRVSAKPNRYKMTTESTGSSTYVTLERADEPTVVGTPLNAEMLNSKADGGYGYGGERLEAVSYDGTDEAEFDELLEAVFSGMDIYTAKQIRFYAPNLLANTNFVGTLFKPGNSNYGVLRGHSYSATRGTLVVKQKYEGGWLPFEWENPPMILDVEYRTTERFNYKPVYAKTIAVEARGNVGAMAPNDSMNPTVIKVIRQNAVFHGSTLQRPLSVSEAHVFTDGSENFGGEYNLPEGYSGTIYFQVWYTKE